MVAALAVVFVCTWVGMSLLFDARSRRPRPEPLADRLARHQAAEVAADAEEWLRRL